MLREGDLPVSQKCPGTKSCQGNYFSMNQNTLCASPVDVTCGQFSSPPVNFCNWAAALKTKGNTD